jgi:MGT family glycosyltransferase
MAKIAIINIGMHGHVNPTLGFAQELVARGHQVSFFSTPEFENSVRATGAQFVPYESVLGKDIGSTAKIQAQYVADGVTPPQSMSMVARFLGEFSSTFSTLFHHLSQNRPDIIVYDFVSLAAWIIARHLKIKTVKFYTTYASNPHYDLMRETFAKNEQPDPKQLEYVQNLIDKICQGHGCESVPISTLMGHMDDDNLVFMPRSFQPCGETFDGRFHFVGPCIRPTLHENVLPLIPQGSGPVMLVSLGSLYHEWPEFYKSCLSAFTNTPWRVVMAVGKLNPKDLGPIPPNFAVMSHIPQIELLPYGSLFISHGGMNSTMEAGSFGVPLVVIPQIEEQEVTALRVEESKLGRYLKRSNITPDVLRTAVEEVHNSQKIYQNMTRLKDEIAQCGGSNRVCDIIESRLKTTFYSPNSSFAAPKDLKEKVLL